MADKTITARRATYDGKIGTVQFTAGSATVDDTTAAGKAAIAFAVRHGWAVSGGPAATSPTVAEGKPYADWTEGEIDTYLAAEKIGYPSNAPLEDKRALIKTAFETKAQGGSGLPEGVAGHDSGTIPPEGAPPVSAPSKPDDPTETIHYHTPLTGGAAADVAPAITVQPAATSKVQGATATYNVTATGTPAPTYQWQRQTKGVGSYADIVGATSAAYTTPALTVADNHNDRYRVVVTNTDSSVTSNSVQQAVTAS